ncbi:competence type IV pilus minor pilin ComGD [Litchfieldia alkalitelluris]|uniref:competence type IV pilus minor pilin ComGD n=1 Tax=Litchfieldia alkalitelluris TaxID=304268 RepID=UPI00099784F1|nr:competence type IV pilus minor pilin ComGD [Litchfieldia alkalitelluris]
MEKKSSSQMVLLVKVSNKGFTLIELLIVLSILFIITILPIIKLFPIYNNKVIDQFFVQLTNDILYTQEYAISRSETMRIYFDNNNSSYRVIVIDGSQTILTRNYDKEIDINNFTLGNMLYFKSNGNINKAGTLQVKYRDQKYNVVFQLGRGRFYVTKL